MRQSLLSLWNRTFPPGIINKWFPVESGCHITKATKLEYQRVICRTVGCNCISHSHLMFIMVPAQSVHCLLLSQWWSSIIESQIGPLESERQGNTSCLLIAAFSFPCPSYEKVPTDSSLIGWFLSFCGRQNSSTIDQDLQLLPLDTPLIKAGSEISRTRARMRN